MFPFIQKIYTILYRIFGKAQGFTPQRSFPKKACSKINYSHISIIWRVASPPGALRGAEGGKISNQAFTFQASLKSFSLSENILLCTPAPRDVTTKMQIENSV